MSELHLSERRPLRQYGGAADANRRRHGAAVVEMAIVLPLLLLFAFAAVDLGRIVHAHVVVSNAARAGAEYGSMHNHTDSTRTAWEARVRDAVDQEMRGLTPYAAAKLTTSVVTVDDTDGLFRVTVEVTYPFNTVSSIPGLPRDVELCHSVVMRQIR